MRAYISPLLYFIYIVGDGPLVRSAWKHIQQSLSPSSIRHYTASFKLFLAYLFYNNVQLQNCNHRHLVAFLELLRASNLSFPTILNYMSAIKFWLYRANLHVDLVTHPLVGQMLKACARSATSTVAVKKVFHVELMVDIVQQAMQMPHGKAYAALFLLAFHGFFRISNLVPVSLINYNVQQHLSRGDVIFAPPGAHVLLKWSKTLQEKQGRLIQLSAIPHSPLCPVQALRNYIAANPAHPNHPFFTLSHSATPTITQSMARQALSQVLRALNLNPTSYSFHTFRHSGATLAFQLGVPMDHIQAHGTWRSQAVWSYLNSASTSVVASAFSTFLSN